MQVSPLHVNMHQIPVDDNAEVINPDASGSSNIMRRIKRAMRACDIYMSSARWTFVRLFCAVCAGMGQQQRSKVPLAMAIIIRDDMFVGPRESCTVRLGFEITKLREKLLQLAHRPTVYERAVRAFPV